MALERRSHPRFPFSSRLEVRLARPAHSEEGRPHLRAVPAAPASPPAVRGTAVDVSVGGFCFRSERPLAVGDVIAVSLPDVASPGEPVGMRSSTGDLSILAVVRRVDDTTAASAEGRSEYLIGAERRPDGAMT